MISLAPVIGHPPYVTYYGSKQFACQPVNAEPPDRLVASLVLAAPGPRGVPWNDRLALWYTIEHQSTFGSHRQEKQV